jgi:hypothetical protein
VPEHRSQRTGQSSLRELREQQHVDQTLQNLLRALTLNLELQARYRVFEFEAAQDGYPDTAALFGQLRAQGRGQTSDLMARLHQHLGDGLRQAGEGLH